MIFNFDVCITNVVTVCVQSILGYVFVLFSVSLMFAMLPFFLWHKQK